MGDTQIPNSALLPHPALTLLWRTLGKARSDGHHPWVASVHGGCLVGDHVGLAASAALPGSLLPRSVQTQGLNPLCWDKGINRSQISLISLGTFWGCAGHTHRKVLSCQTCGWVGCRICLAVCNGELGLVAHRSEVHLWCTEDCQEGLCLGQRQVECEQETERTKKVCFIHD